jgi:aspartyl-tRNA synthetase
MRSHLCGEVNETLAGQTVTLCGWVDRRRDLGGLIFLGLRDLAGIVQVVIEPESDAFAGAERLRNEYCVRLKGTVRMRPESQWNEDMATGKVELVADEVELLNASAPLPLMMTEEDGEEVRLRYRYLDLRRPRMQHNMRIRAKLNQAIHKHLDGNGFYEFETPILTKATPEGARDYLVPSRVHAGQFLCLAAVTPVVQAAADDGWYGSLLPNRPLLPRRRSARRPPAGVYPAGYGIVLC